MTITLQDAIRFLEEKHDYSGLTANKVMYRGKVIEADSTDEELVFEVERHEAVLGAVYTRDFAMDAFITRWRLYSFDGSDVIPIGESRPPLLKKNDIRFSSLADQFIANTELHFDIEVVDKEIYQITDNFFGTKRIVSSMDEVSDFAQSVVEEFCYDSEYYSIIDYVTESEAKDIIDELSEAVVSAAIDLATEETESVPSFLEFA